MRFTLEIEFGNEAMQTPDDVAGALEQTASRLMGIEGITSADDAGLVFDLNGNTVGQWSVTE